MDIEPRYEPSWGNDGDAQLIARIGPLDIYYEYNYDNNGEEWLLVVGPRTRKIQDRSYNFDVYRIDGSNITPTEEYNDMHVELHEMCALYELAIAHGYIKKPKENN